MNQITQMKTEPLGLQFEAIFKESLLKVLGSYSSVGEILRLCKDKQGVQDQTTKFLIKDEKGFKVAVALCSAPISPLLIARGVENSRLAKQILGSKLGSHILEPLCEGKVNNCSYVVLPYCKPLSNSRFLWYYQRYLLSPSLLGWLSQVTEVTKTKVSSDEITQNFITPLKHLIELEAMTEKFRTKASQSLERLENGDWEPFYVLIHNDLWKGNILIDHRNLSNSTSLINNKNLRNLVDSSWIDNFVIIDWLGSIQKGYAIYDLVRLAQSLKLRPKQLRHEVALHCKILNCDLVDAYSYLLAAIGYLGMHLEYFPFPRFVQLADSCLETLEKAMMT